MIIKSFPTLCFVLLVLTLLFITSASFAQNKPVTRPATKKKPPPTTQSGKTNTSSASFENNKVIEFRPGQIDTFQTDAGKMVFSFQNMLNNLANSAYTIREKQTIVNSSYLKLFWNSKVSIEDIIAL